MVTRQLLLVDDDLDQLDIFMDALREISGPYNCTYADGPEKAIEMIRNTIPDFIFLDYNMPRMNGIQLLSVLRHEPKLKKAKIFIYSSSVTDEIQKMARLMGASGCIEKPPKLSRLVHDFKAIFAGDLLPGFAYLTAN